MLTAVVGALSALRLRQDRVDLLHQRAFFDFEFDRSEAEYQTQE